MISLDVTVSVGAGTLEVGGFIPTTQSAQLVFKNFATYVDDDTRVRLLVNGDLVSESGAFTKGQLDATCVVPTGTSEIKALECACEGPAQIGVQIVVADCTGGIETVTGRGVMLFNWEEQQARSGGGSQTVVGDVASVNGKKGTVVLSASDVGALPSNGVADYAEKLKNKTTSETAEIGKDDDNATRIVVKDSSGEKVGDVAYMDDVEDAVSAAVIGINEELDDKQDKLTAGNNITIVGNVISATGGGGGGSGTVKSVNNQSPDANGNVALSAANVGAVASTNGTATNLTIVGSSIAVKETASAPSSKTIFLNPGNASVTMGESGNNAVSISHSGVSVYDSDGQRDVAFPASEGTLALVSQIPTTASQVGALAVDGTAANATKAASLVEGSTSAFVDTSSYSKPRICINSSYLEDEEVVANLSDLATKSEMTNLALPYMVDEDGNARSSSYKYSKDESCTVSGVLWKSLYDENEYEPSEEDHPLPEEVATTETPNGPWWKKERLDAPENAIMVDGDTGVASIIDAKTGEVKWCELTLIPYDQLDRTAGTDGVYQLIQHANNHIKLTTGNSIYVRLPGAVVDNGNEDDDSRVAKVRDLLIDVESTFVPPDFSETETYAQGAFVKYNGKYYKCNTASYTAGAFDSEVFDECGEHGVLFSGTDGTDFNLYVMESSGAASAEEVMRVPFGKRMSIYVTECYPTVTTTTSGTTTTTTSVPCFQVASQVFSKVPAVTPAATTTSET